MNVFSNIHLVAHVPKSHSPDCPTRIGYADAGRERIFAQEYARTLDLYWKIHIGDTDLFSLMSQPWLTCDPKWKCHHKHKILWLKLQHSFQSYSPEQSLSAFGWTWRRKWVRKLSRYCGRGCGLHSQEAGMWTPIRAHSPIASTSTCGSFSWPSPSCCIW